MKFPAKWEKVNPLGSKEIYSLGKHRGRGALNIHGYTTISRKMTLATKKKAPKGEHLKEITKKRKGIESL